MGEVDGGGFVLVSKGRDGRGWGSIASKLHLVLHFFHPRYGGGSGGLHFSSRLVLGAGNSQDLARVKTSGGGGGK